MDKRIVIQLDGATEDICRTLIACAKQRQANFSHMARIDLCPKRTTLWRVRNGKSQALIRAIALLKAFGISEITVIEKP